MSAATASAAIKTGILRKMAVVGELETLEVHWQPVNVSHVFPAHHCHFSFKDRY